MLASAAVVDVDLRPDSPKRVERGHLHERFVQPSSKSLTVKSHRNGLSVKNSDDNIKQELIN